MRDLRPARLQAGREGLLEVRAVPAGQRRPDGRESRKILRETG